MILREVPPEGPSTLHHFSAGRVRIGRAEENDLPLADITLSRHHLQLEYDEARQRWKASPRPTTNGTTINGVPLLEPRDLNEGDQIFLGGWSLIVERSRVPKTDVALASAETQDAEGSRPVPEALPALIGESIAIQEVRRQVGVLAAADVSVLLVGESGTGKGLVARLLHRLGPRHEQEFADIDMPAIPPDLFEAELFGIVPGGASQVVGRRGRCNPDGGGTVFLDEIGVVPTPLQAKLLKFVEGKIVPVVGGKPVGVDVRILAATNEDLEAAVAAGRFRSDLYHRLKLQSIRLPPLRERPDDIPILAKHFLACVGHAAGIDDEALRELQARQWPGNVRQLKAVVEGAVLWSEGGVVTAAHLTQRETTDPVGATVQALLDQDGDFWELVIEPLKRKDWSREQARRVVARLLEASDGSYTKLAKRLGLDTEGGRRGYKRLTHALEHFRLRPRDGDES